MRPVHLITDRAKRYRAQNAIPADAPRLCTYCGDRGNLQVEHVNGREEDGAPDNLTYACRSCNTRKGIVFAHLRVGRRTMQFNPAAKGAANLAQWSMAVASILRRDKRTGELLPPDQWKAPGAYMPIAEAVAMIRATPHSKRAEFQAALRAKRRTSARDWEVPF